MIYYGSIKFIEKLEFLSIMANQLSKIAYQKLKNSILLEDLKMANNKLEKYKGDLELLLAEKTIEVKKLSGLLPICSHCHKIRDDKGYWNQIEAYIQDHSEVRFSHSICKECAEKHYPDMDIYED